MKRIILPITIAASACMMQMNAQVGVNTTTPAATLDVIAKNATGTTTTPEGILIPRADRQRVQSMTGVSPSTLIYVNSISNGTQAGTAVNIDAVGYYFYNGTVWGKLGADVITNLYTNNGTLKDNRTVTQADKTLAFTGTAVNALSVDGTTFSVDAANNRVGIGTISPNKSLDVVSPGTEPSSGIAQFLYTNLSQGIGIGYTGIQKIGSQANSFLSLDAAGSGNLLLQTVATGNVGIGTATPQKKLHVNGTLQVTNELNVGGDATTAGSAGTTGQVLTSAGTGAAPTWATPAASTNIYNSDGSLNGNRTVTQAANTLAFTGTAVNALSVDGTTFSVDAANNRVGIGTTTPNSLLDLGPTTGRKLAIYNNAADNLFYGLGLITSGALAFYTEASATTDPRMVLDKNGNLGIGTISPSRSLDVVSSGVQPSTGIAQFRFTNLTQGVGIGYTGIQKIGTLADSFLSVDAAGSGHLLFQTIATGNVGIGVANPTEKLAVKGKVSAIGYETVSDIRLKKDITDNTYGLKEILNLRTINYRYKDEELSKEKKIGFIAQEVKATIPELVNTANDAMKTLSVNYGEMTVVLTKALQELQTIVQKQQEEINALKQQLKPKP
ncbi:tail fiber domain-containing protein [Chryseobacterium sp. JM1]|uniref:tail fiber domain-containing protein n=1 Tax=Chryseobacterium sp. JM1 TaxID=1233950 RepID=UPI000A9F8911|nr:tail fiber domain-containing protein [Chryseobacterium sp. JM1]